MTTYYPGSADEGGAQHVRARAGAETPGIEIRMVTGRLFHITGTVMDSQGRPATRISGNLTRRTGNMGSFSFGFATDDQGRFQMRSIPSGTYRIGVRQRPMQFNADGSNTDPGEMASVPLTVGGDVDNLMIITTAGATITGQIVFEQGAPPQMPQAMRVNASFGNPEDMAMGIGTPTAATVSPDLTFTMKGMLGEYLLRTNAPNQYLKSVTLGGEDITDAPREFKTGDRVTLTLTSRASTLEFVDPYGHYKLTGLMPGRYFVAAVPRDRLNTPPGADATFFEQLAKEATSVVVGEDEQRQADLKVVVMESGGN